MSFLARLTTHYETLAAGKPKPISRTVKEMQEKHPEEMTPPKDMGRRAREKWQKDQARKLSQEQPKAGDEPVDVSAPKPAAPEDPNKPADPKSVAPEKAADPQAADQQKQPAVNDKIPESQRVPVGDSGDGGDGGDDGGDEGDLLGGKDGKSGVKTGKSYSNEQGRFDYLRSTRPYLLVLNGYNHPQTLIDWFKNQVPNVIGNKDYVEKLYGSSKSKDQGPIGSTYAYLIGEQMVQQFKDSFADANYKELPHAFYNMDKFMTKARPFDSLDFKSLGIPQDKQIRDELQSAWDKLKGDDESGQSVSATQIGAQIPLNYSRFMSAQRQKWDIHLGNVPEGAGRAGLAYIISDQSQFNKFQAWIKSFQPPTNFSDEVFFVKNLDVGFRMVDPKPYTPANCVILRFEKAVDPNMQVDTSGKEVKKAKEPWDDGEEQVAAKTSSGFLDKIKKGYKALKDANSGNDQKAQKILDEQKKKEPAADPKMEQALKGDKNITLTEYLSSMAKVFMKSPVTKPGGYHKAAYVYGNMVVHYNKDFTQAILWGGPSPIPATEQTIKDALPGLVASVDLTYKG